MEIQTLQYSPDQGWSTKTFPQMDSDNTLILIFADPAYIDNPAPIKELAQHFPKSKIIGCSTASEIAGPNILDKSLSVSITRFENTPLELAKTEIKSAEDSFAAGEAITKQLSQKNGLRGIFVLAEGLNINGSELVKGLNKDVGNDTVITGGLAGDGKDFKRTWIVVGGEILPNYVAGIGFYGDHIQIGHASKGGWDIFGPERRITRSKNNILYELDEKPALVLYKEYLGERAAGLPATGLLYPLAIRKDVDDQGQLVRTILGIDEENQALIFAGDMPMGYFAQLMRANFERLIASASDAGGIAIQRMLDKKIDDSTPVLAVAISCVGRRLLLGERTDEETDSMLSTLPSKTSQVGFYSYGELSPHTTGSCDLHNQTMTLTTFCEI